MARASKIELIKRRQEVQQLIVQGTRYTDICDILSKKYETSRGSIENDIKLVYKEWQDKAEKPTQLLRNKNKERLEFLLNSAILKEQYKTALEIQKEINKIDGLYKEKEQEEKAPEIIRIGRRSDLKVVGDE